MEIYFSLFKINESILEKPWKMHQHVKKTKLAQNYTAPQMAIIDAMLSLSRNIKYILYITVHLLGDKSAFT